MFAARQASSLVGAVQRRAFSASASNVRAMKLNPQRLDHDHWDHRERIH